MDEALEPKLTRYDQRVLSKLDQWTADRDTREDSLRWMDLWEVGRTLTEHDLRELQRVLDGLERFGYVTASGWGPQRRWIAAPWKREAMLRDSAANAL
jgi:hypothetical protein